MVGLWQYTGYNKYRWQGLWAQNGFKMFPPPSLNFWFLNGQCKGGQIAGDMFSWTLWQSELNLCLMEMFFILYAFKQTICMYYFNDVRKTICMHDFNDVRKSVCMHYFNDVRKTICTHYFNDVRKSICMYYFNDVRITICMHYFNDVRITICNWIQWVFLKILVAIQ